MPFQSLPISLIAAVSKNFVLGEAGKIPWHLTKDFAYFKAKTLNKPIIMGRKTFESIGRALPHRKNIVLTRQNSFQISGNDTTTTVCKTLEESLSCAYDYLDKNNPQEKEIMIIGGADIYNLFLDLADSIYLTEVELTCKGDTFFPNFNRDHWNLISSTADCEANHNNLIHFSFNVYKKI